MKPEFMDDRGRLGAWNLPGDVDGSIWIMRLLGGLEVGRSTRDE